jgi:O-antigen ligase
MEQGIVASFMTLALDVNKGLAQIIGVDPMLILSVVVLVSIGDLIFKIRKNFPDKADLVLLGACVLMSIIVSLFAVEDIETWKQVSRHAFVLSGMTTLAYKVGKPIVKFFVMKKLKQLEDAGE